MDIKTPNELLRWFWNCKAQFAFNRYPVVTMLLWMGVQGRTSPCRGVQAPPQTYFVKAQCLKCAAKLLDLIIMER